MRPIPFQAVVPGLILVAAMHWTASLAESAEYLADIKPLLTEHCTRCHGATQQKGGLRLDTAAAAARGGHHGPAFLPGQSAPSLLVQVLEGSHSDLPRMPYKKPALSAAQLDAIRAWIDQGAAFPADEQLGSQIHWSFLPPVRHTPPPVPPGTLVRTKVDHFIFGNLASHNLRPSPEAPRETLIRRLSLDLIGLPPTLGEIDAFVSDRRPDAYDRLVERLLNSPHYGERWGRWWLDVARYADSNGYSIDAPRAIWKYRDWVVTALNDDMPFDRFVLEQLAGDLLPDPAPSQLIATGFNRNTQINQEGGIDPEQFRIESVFDRVDTLGSAFLGLTIACAQCHDHKFDPVSQREYYQLFAFFNNTVQDGHGAGKPGGLYQVPGEFENQEEHAEQIEEAEEDLDRYLNTQGSAQQQWEHSLTPTARAQLTPQLRAILDIPFADRTRSQKRDAYAAFRPDDPEFKSRRDTLGKLERREPKPVTTLVMQELPRPRESVVFIKGDFTRPGEKVQPGFPAVIPTRLHTDPAGEPAGTGSPPLNRLDLARWLVDPTNPLTARVAVNRVWQVYFGKGLVETENDFGTQGLPPTHPELLDWLATEFIAQQWSLKAIHRTIVRSATYRQSSNTRPDLDLADPRNTLLARQNRIRLDAELVRDNALAIAGLLVPKAGGPPVFPPQPDGVMNLGQSRRPWNASTGPDRYRRGLYTFFWRATPHPALTVFDAPDAFSACTRRIRSNTPLQALTLLNDAQFHEFAEALAGRILKEAPASDAARIRHGFRLALARPPSPEESRRLTQLLNAQHRPSPARTQDAAKGPVDPTTRDAWTTVAKVLLNLDETLTRE